MNVALHDLQERTLPFGPGNALEPLLAHASPSAARFIRRTAWSEALRVFGEHGPAALIEPRERAAAHEAGHAVVYAAFGYRVTDCRVSEIRGRGGWSGFTNYDAEGWTVGPETDPADDVAHLARMLAGVIGEQMAGAYHDVSALDERIAANILAATIADKLAVGSGLSLDEVAERLLTQVAADVARITVANAGPFDELRQLLLRRRIARQPVLDRILGGVRRMAITDLRTLVEATAP